MSRVLPDVASPPVSPDHLPVGCGHGRAGSQRCVVGMGETSRAVFGAEEVGEEVVGGRGVTARGLSSYPQHAHPI